MSPIYGIFFAGRFLFDDTDEFFSSFIRPFGNRMAEIRMLVSIVIRMAFFPHFFSNFLDQGAAAGRG
jgi:hypothetical protein